MIDIKEDVEQLLSTLKEMEEIKERMSQERSQLTARLATIRNTLLSLPTTQAITTLLKTHSKLNSRINRLATLTKPELKQTFLKELEILEKEVEVEVARIPEEGEGEYDKDNDNKYDKDNDNVQHQTENFSSCAVEQTSSGVPITGEMITTSFPSFTPSQHSENKSAIPLPPCPLPSPFEPRSFVDITNEHPGIFPQDSFNMPPPGIPEIPTMPGIMEVPEIPEIPEIPTIPTEEDEKQPETKRRSCCVIF